MNLTERQIEAIRMAGEALRKYADIQYEDGNEVGWSDKLQLAAELDEAFGFPPGGTGIVVNGPRSLERNQEAINHVVALSLCAYSERDMHRWKAEVEADPTYINPAHAMALVEFFGWAEGPAPEVRR